MTVSRPTKTAVLTLGALLMGSGVAHGKQEELATIQADAYKCKPLGPENYLEPPPPLSTAEGETAKLTKQIDRFTEMNKLAQSPCPEGEIAYPRPLTGMDPKSAPPVDGEGKGQRQESTRSSQQKDDSASTLDYVTTPYFNNEVVGVDISINVAQPDVGPQGSHSLAQLLISGPELRWQTVELGWTSEQQGPDSPPKLFTFVNKDGYSTFGQNGGDCYNCNFTPAVGAEYSPGQDLVPSPPPHNTSTLKFGLDAYGGNWWVWVGDQWIGYLNGDFWQGDFTVGSHYAYFGEVSDDGDHTTDMGNGNFGTDSYASAMLDPHYSVWKGERKTYDGYLPSVAASHPLWYNGAVNSQHNGFKFGGPGAG